MLSKRFYNHGCLWSDKDNFCDMLKRSSVPLDDQWPILILYMRGLKDDRFLSEVQKSRMQEIFLTTVQGNDFSAERLTAIQEEIQRIVTAPYEQKLREIARETRALAEEANKILGDRCQDMMAVAEIIDTDLDKGMEPMGVLAGLRGALRDIAAKMDADTAHLTQMSHKDSLTGLANRRSFDACLDEAAKQWERHKTPAALIIFDIDQFKNFNDSYGHLGGDQVLRILAERLLEIENALRNSGAEALAARLGGDEFTLTLRGSAAVHAVEIGERIRRAVEETTLSLRDVNGQILSAGLKVTVSVGVADFWSGWTGAFQANLLDYADKALYHAKAGGKNCTVEYTPDGEQMYTPVAK